jgi:hypothetical protein
MSQIKARLSRFAQTRSWASAASFAVCLVLMSATAPQTARTAVAQTLPRLTPPPWPDACKAANGNPVIPNYASGSNYAWSFIANFNQVPSDATIRGCLTEAELTASGMVLYVTLVGCPIQNNITTPKKLLGGGNAVFDGNVYVTCSLGLQAAHRPDNFYIRARALLPTSGMSYTLMTSPPATFVARLDASCNLTLKSTYVNALTNEATLFSSAAGSAKCNSMMGIGSRIQPAQVTHFVDSLAVTPVLTPSLKISIPMTFSFQIGSVGQPYTLDEFIIDPQPLRCCTSG